MKAPSPLFARFGRKGLLMAIHAPFTANKLAELASREGPLARFSFRAQAPLFLGQPIRLQAAAGELRAIRGDGAVAMTAVATCNL